MSEPQLIYHYTGLSSGIAILASNSLFATNIRFLNDRSEYDFGLAHFRQAVQHYWVSEIKNFSKKNIPPKSVTGLKKIEAVKVVKNFYKTIMQPFAERYMRNLHDTIIRRGVYAVCFCEHDSVEEIESGILSQWRGYAAGGLAIGFRRAELELTLKRHLKPRNISGFSCRKIMYAGHTPGIDVFIRESTSAVIRCIWECLLILQNRYDFEKLTVTDVEEFKDAFLGDSRETELVKLRESFWELSGRIAPVPALIKHHAFREERETRILVWPASDLEVAGLGIKFFATQNLVKPYLELSSEQKLPVGHILVGPHPEQERRAEALRLALEQLGFEARVTCSRIPVTM